MTNEELGNFLGKMDDAVQEMFKQIQEYPVLAMSLKKQRAVYNLARCNVENILKDMRRVID